MIDPGEVGAPGQAGDERVRALLANSADAVVVLDEHGYFRFVSPAIERIFGWTPDEVRGRPWTDFVLEDDHEMVAGSYAEILGQGEDESYTGLFRARTRQGPPVWAEVVTVNHLANPVVGGIVMNVRDVTERLEAEQALRAAQRERARLTEIVEMTSDLVTISTVDGVLVYLNDAARRFVGLGATSPLDAVDLARHFTAATVERLAHEVVDTLDRAGIWSGELDLVDGSGRVIPVLAQVLAHRDAAGAIEYVSTVLRDITERKGFEIRLAHEATHDPLTGLPNRTLLIDRLDHALTRGHRHGSGVAVLFCDLDHFKVVNDSLGHSVGDRVLVEVAARLQAQLRPGDTVSRFGGDEFVVLCEDCADVDAAVAVATRVDEAMSAPFLLDEDHEVYVGLSVGIALAELTVSTDDPEALIRDADAAMYKAKERGRGRHQVFDHGIYVQAVDRFDVANALRHAVGRGELVVEYQPIVALEAPVDAPLAGRVRTVEALVRWNHPVRGRLLPDDFIAVAEETGLVLGVGEWVLREACAQMAGWIAELGPAAPGTLAVNLSARQLEHPDLVGVVERAVVDTGLAPGRLELEVTESVLMHDVDRSHETLGMLKELGVHLSVDDFGTGYSSLSYLRRFPVDRLKVDRSFVDGLGSEPEDSAIVAAVVSLAHTLGLVAVGEGVETAEQYEALRELGCDLAQGFVLGGPMPADELTARLRHG